MNDARGEHKNAATSSGGKVDAPSAEVTGAIEASCTSSSGPEKPLFPPALPV